MSIVINLDKWANNRLLLLIKYLFSQNKSLSEFSKFHVVWSGSLILLLIQLIVLFIFSIYFPSYFEMKTMEGDISSKLYFIVLVVLTPITENSIILWLIIFLREKLGLSVVIVNVIVSSFAALMHGIKMPFWGLSIFCSFWVYSNLILKFGNYKIGFLITLSMHLLHNFIAYIILVIID